MLPEGVGCRWRGGGMLLEGRPVLLAGGGVLLKGSQHVWSGGRHSGCSTSVASSEAVTRSGTATFRPYHHDENRWQGRGVKATCTKPDGVAYEM